ncbi:MAG: metal-dependent transcriptional regulator [Ruminococcaceae bacterium]|nr:metal-dependent transcriptional regulator [Oscillospiraceae bacterium]
MVIHEAAENYLETIYMLRKRNGSCRSVDVAAELGYSKPTISVMMKNLRENGYIRIDDGGELILTETGMGIALRMYERHEIIAEVLMKMGVSEDTAYKDACKIEHDISDETFDAIKRQLPRFSEE